mgnify:CR=1 FL=1
MASPQSYPDLTGVTVAQIIPRLNVGGAETTTLEIARALRAANARALVVSEGGALADALAAAGAELVNMPVASKNPFVMAANIRRLRQLVEGENINMAFCCWQPRAVNPFMTVPAMAALELLPAPPEMPPRAPGPFAFEDAEYVEAILDDGETECTRAARAAGGGGKLRHRRQ